jgi:hypothetical protein
MVIILVGMGLRQFAGGWCRFHWIVARRHFDDRLVL